jgi:peptidoglycan/xylan/chitin deacetylase (PgdA/CDA1 family)
MSLQEEPAENPDSAVAEENIPENDTIVPGKDAPKDGTTELGKDAPEDGTTELDKDAPEDSTVEPVKEAQTDTTTEPEQKYAALTFDDGPHPVYTPKLLDGLAQRNVHATFFVIGSNIPGNEAIIERMHQEGHVIGNHTYDHVKISDMNAADACAQVEKTSALVREITGEDTEFVRPPFGAWNKALEAPFVMIPVLWDVDPLDWTTKNTTQVVRNVLDEVESGDIILLHDCYESSVNAALQIIDELQRQGYEFLTVEEMILE